MPLGTTLDIRDMGGTTTGQAAESAKYYQHWQREYIDGTTTLQFREWLREKKLQNRPTAITGTRG